jgi:hypothetical protein
MKLFSAPKLKHSLKGTYLQPTEDIHRMTGLLKGLSQLSDMLPGIAGTHAVLCRCPRKLLWRR